MKTLRSAFCSAFFLIGTMPLAVAQGTYTQIDYPGAITTVTDGLDMAGDVAGSYLDTGGYWHGFLLTGATYTTIDHPNTQDTYLFGLNDSGQAAGTTPNGLGFIYDIQTASFTQIAYPGAHSTVPIAINNSGVVTGYFIKNGSGQSQGFEYAASTYVEVRPPGASATFASGITTSGEIVGTATLTSGEINFALVGGKYRKLSIPNAPGAFVLGINPAGNALVGG